MNVLRFNKSHVIDSRTRRKLARKGTLEAFTIARIESCDIADAIPASSYLAALSSLTMKRLKGEALSVGVAKQSQQVTSW